MALVDIDLDLQILICTFLDPSDILTLRKTCRTLQFVTSQRIVWVDALRRVCLENRLFLPSFPILDMSDVEVEQAATARRRWNELATPFAARGTKDSEVILPPTTIRIIDDPLESFYTADVAIVPGGRYMVHFSESHGGFGVWDLGYTSSSDCKLIASVVPEGGCHSGQVHATPDGMGLVIFSIHPSGCSFYEMYPQSETPQLIEIARLDDLPAYFYNSSYVSPDKLIWYDPDLEENQETIFRVWDYRLNASVSFVALTNLANTEGTAKVVATQTAIIILHEEEILIWAIPPLLPQPPNSDDYSLAQFPPAIRVKFPDGLPLYRSPITWRTMSSWYFDPSKPLYFDKVYSSPSQLQRFKIIIKPDCSDATLHFINAIQTTNRFDRETSCELSMFCEDTLVSIWNPSNPDSDWQCGIYIGSTLSGPALS